MNEFAARFTVFIVTRNIYFNQLQTADNAGIIYGRMDTPPDGQTQAHS